MISVPVYIPYHPQLFGLYPVSYTHLMRMKTGKYYIGDPCYVVEDQNDWIKLLEDTNYFKNKNQSYKGQPIYCGGTAYGDGCYESNKGKCYGVDAGLLGIMPVEVIDIPETEAEMCIRDRCRCANPGSHRKERHRQKP